MTRRTSGWVVLLAAGGMMAGLLGAEVSGFSTWAEATSPAFIGQALVHFGAVAAAFVSGQLVPTTAALKKE